jgi:hypothetical protein
LIRQDRLVASYHCVSRSEKAFQAILLFAWVNLPFYGAKLTIEACLVNDVLDNSDSSSVVIEPVAEADVEDNGRV